MRWQILGAIGAATLLIAGCGGAVRAAKRAAMAQWWAPWRRQQGGRRDSLLESRAAASGPRLKNRIKKMEKPRRIWF